MTQDAVVLRFSHYEWAKPTSLWSSAGLPYFGAVAVQSNVGWLLLVRVSQDLNTGETVRELVKESELILAPDMVW